jgi:hypothetical protein
VTHKTYFLWFGASCMVTPIDVAFVLVGVVLLFAGAALSIYGVGAMGLVLGGGGGYLAAPTMGGFVGLSGVAASVAAVLIGALIGVAVTYILLSMAVASIAFIVGAYFGLVIAEPLVGASSLLVSIPVAIGVGIAAAFLGTFLTRTTMIAITSFVGAVLASRAVTVEQFERAQSDVTIDPLLFDLAAPVFLGLFVLGVLSQFGLFKLGYVTKLVTWLPGATVFQDGKGTKS